MKCIIGKNAVSLQAPEFLYDESRFTLGVPRKLCFPETADDARSIILEASAQHVPITIIGGKTGITGGCVPQDDCIAVCLSKMTGITELRRLADGAPMLVCGPGISLETISAFCDAPDQWKQTIDRGHSLAQKEWFYPPDPTEMTAHLGGTVSTNASGARSFHFGPTRAFIEELSCVLSSGDTATIRRGEGKEQNGVFSLRTDQGNVLSFQKPAYAFPRIKNASGYYSGPDMDIIDLFIGSEGTLALFTSIGIKLVRKPPFISGLSFFPDRANAFQAARFLRGQAHIAAIEYFDASALAVLNESRNTMSLDIPQFPSGLQTALYWEYIESPADPFENRIDLWEVEFVRLGSSFENTWSGFEKADVDKLKAFRHAVPETVNTAVGRYKRDCPGIRKVSTDAAFPEDAFEKSMDIWFDLVADSHLEYAVFGHIGDFHLHFNLLPHNESELATALRLYGQMMDVAIAAGGTVSAEHGIGKLKTDYLRRMYGDTAIDEMKRIKSAFDPHWILNRGNLFDHSPVPGSSA